jgi:hypothetical protein
LRILPKATSRMLSSRRSSMLRKCEEKSNGDDTAVLLFYLLPFRVLKRQKRKDSFSHRFIVWKSWKLNSWDIADLRPEMNDTHVKVFYLALALSLHTRINKQVLNTVGKFVRLMFLSVYDIIIGSPRST